MFRGAENDAAAGDRQQIQLEAHALAVLVLPGRADAGPVFLIAPLRDMPGNQCRRRVRGVGFGVGGLVFGIVVFLQCSG